MHDPHGWGWLGKVVTGTPCVHFSGWQKPYGPRVVWVQGYPPVGCINSLNCRALGHENAIVLSVSVVEVRCGFVVVVWTWWLCGSGQSWYLLYF